MTAPDAVLVGVLDAIEAAGLGGMAYADARRLADQLVARMPQLAAGCKERASWERWTPEQEAELADLYSHGVPVKVIATRLQRTEGATRGAISRLRLGRGDGTANGKDAAHHTSP